MDRFSGRVLEGRKYSDGLQQSIQTKEGLPCSSQSQVIATITYQSLFRLFYKLSGMTGTALTDFKVCTGREGMKSRSCAHIHKPQISSPSSHTTTTNPPSHPNPTNPRPP